MAYDVSSKKFKRIMGYNDLWMLEANLNAADEKTVVAVSVTAS